MPFEAICLICNEWFEHQGSIFDMNFLYNDELYHGEPICTDCICESFGVHLDYEPVSLREPRGLEIFL